MIGVNSRSTRRSLCCATRDWTAILPDADCFDPGIRWNKSPESIIFINRETEWIRWLETTRSRLRMRSVIIGHQYKYQVNGIYKQNWRKCYSTTGMANNRVCSLHDNSNWIMQQVPSIIKFCCESGAAATRLRSGASWINSNSFVTARKHIQTKHEYSLNKD